MNAVTTSLDADRATQSRPGLLVPPLTPFTEQRTVDYDLLAVQIDDIIAWSKPSMVLAAAVEAQEYHYLSPNEREELARRTVEFVGGRCPVAVGISHPHVDTALKYADLAAELGASCLQLLAPLRPFGGQPTTAELVAYYEAITSRVDIPVLLYLNPGPGADVSVDATIEIAAIDGIGAVKESSRDLTRIGLLISEVDEAGLASYYTTMQVLLASLHLGGSGATLPPPASHLAAKIVDAFVAGDHERAAQLQRQLRRFPGRWMSSGLAPVSKAAMKCLGHDAGDPMPPFPPLDESARNELKAELMQTDLWELRR